MICISATFEAPIMIEFLREDGWWIVLGLLPLLTGGVRYHPPRRVQDGDG
jgi:hypothetical protein